MLQLHGADYKTRQYLLSMTSRFSPPVPNLFTAPKTFSSRKFHLQGTMMMTEVSVFQFQPPPSFDNEKKSSRIPTILP